MPQDSMWTKQPFKGISTARAENATATTHACNVASLCCHYRYIFGHTVPPFAIIMIGYWNVPEKKKNSLYSTLMKNDKPVNARQDLKGINPCKEWNVLMHISTCRQAFVIMVRVIYCKIQFWTQKKRKERKTHFLSSIYFRFVHFVVGAS